jgi:hypothetical protein
MKCKKVDGFLSQDVYSGDLELEMRVAASKKAGVSGFFIVYRGIAWVVTCFRPRFFPVVP